MVSSKKIMGPNEKSYEIDIVIDLRFCAHAFGGGAGAGSDGDFEGGGFHVQGGDC